MKYQKYSDPEFIAQLIKEPEEVIDAFQLVYVRKKALAIKRLRKGKSFEYEHQGKVLTDEKKLQRIKDLVIPPIWKQVKIAVPENGHLQAVGKDPKNRKQYRYHDLWTKIRNQTKFFKMASFGDNLPKIRKQVAKDLKQSGWPKSKVIALIISLMEETHIRIGSEQYAKRNKTYGLSTLRNRHVTAYKDALEFNFIGKKGKEHSILLKDKKLMKLVRQCEDIPGWELFQYYDDSGEKHSIESGMINNYIHEITGDLFTSKDFRTWAATTIFFQSLYHKGIATSEKKQKKNILKSYDKAANALGNSRNVCRKYYVHPVVVNKYMSGDIQKEFDQLNAGVTSKKHLSDIETVLLDMIKNYVPDFLENK
jgi:DNA topoisomerase-1